MRERNNKTHAVRRTVEVPGDVIAWLKAEAPAYRFLLAHCEGGVAWGRVADGALVLAPGAAALFTTAVLQEARLFGEDGELHVWRVGGSSFRATRIDERAQQAEKPDFTQAYDEPYVLWGTRCEQQENGFSLMSDGVQGLRHWAPVDVAPRSEYAESVRSLRLVARVYVVQGENGAVQPAASRLVRVEAEAN